MVNAGFFKVLYALAIVAYASLLIAKSWFCGMVLPGDCPASCRALSRASCRASVELYIELPYIDMQVECYSTNLTHTVSYYQLAHHQRLGSLPYYLYIIPPFTFFSSLQHNVVIQSTLLQHYNTCSIYNIILIN